MRMTRRLLRFALVLCLLAPRLLDSGALSEDVLDFRLERGDLGLDLLAQSFRHRIEHVAADHLAVEDRRDSFQILDLNGDGFSDIRLLAGFDNSGRYDKPWYKGWVYQPESHLFVFNPKIL